jgi:HEAT repeat protein
MPLFGPPNIEKLTATGDIPGLIKALNYEGDDGIIRQAAIAALAQIGVAAVPALTQALQSSSPTIAAAAIEALGKSRTPQAQAELRRLLKHPHRFLRAAAARGLRFNLSVDSVFALQAALLDDEETARTAATVLAQLNLPAAWQALQEMLGHPEFQARMAAVHGFSQAGTAATPWLLDVLENGNENARRAAADLLGQLKPSEALPVLLDLLVDPSDYVALAAGGAIQRYGTTAVVPLLKALVQGSDPLKTAAAQQLVNLGGQAERALLTALQNADPDTRARVALILGKIGQAWVIPPLINLGRQEDPSLRYAAVQALAAVGGTRVIEAMINFLDDENTYIRHEAREALIRLLETVETQALRNQIQGALHSHPPERS